MSCQDVHLVIHGTIHGFQTQHVADCIHHIKPTSHRLGFHDESLPFQGVPNSLGKGPYGSPSSRHSRKHFQLSNCRHGIHVPNENPHDVLKYHILSKTVLPRSCSQVHPRHVVQIIGYSLIQSQGPGYLPPSIYLIRTHTIIQGKTLIQCWLTT
jgi:hypothetical protein